MHWRVVFAGICTLLLAATVLTSQGERHALRSSTVINYFKRQQPVFADKALLLEQRINQLKEGDTATLQQAKQALQDCRESYKSISFFLEYFFPSEAYVFNAPAKYEIEEPYIEYEAPIGLQQIEALLYDPQVWQYKADLVAQAEVVRQSALDLPALIYQFSATDQQVLESIQQELIRIMTLYVTGYDAPLLKSGIREATAAMRAMDTVLMPYTGFAKTDSIRYYFATSIALLNEGCDFDSFDRLSFLTDAALPLQRLLNNSRYDLFSPAALKKSVFPSADETGDTALGRRLFFEKALSGNYTRSCATCHQPEKFFTDGLHRNMSLIGDTVLARHTPGLLYTGYQYAQFWDGRAAQLEDQITAVLHSKQEMGANDDTIVQRLHIPLPVIRSSLAAYVRTLAPFNAAFDRYMQGNKSALTTQQRAGGNLFMGKAQCATCHFAPLFNGLIPPLYKRTEFEVLGTPANDDFDHPVADTDSGRLGFFPISFYKGAFKTPTVRNSAVTAPYMHHGAFRDMDKVIDFYDKGGGIGLGLDIPNQTLSAVPLGLSDKEKKALIAFMEALTDGR
jgi:cytochrome c peroxidase